MPNRKKNRSPVKNRPSRAGSAGDGTGVIGVIGMMTGTSCDGLDASLLRFSGPEDWDSCGNLELPYPAALRRRVLDLQKRGTKLTLRELLHLDRDLSVFYGDAVKKVQQRLGRKISTKSPIIVANHGQTVAHHPDLGVTLQLGNPSRIASVTGLTSLGLFRDGDMAVGGQGAPLAPRYHLALARKWLSVGELRRGVAIHNLGGISNLTYICAHGKETEVLAFDTGPANAWIDLAIEKKTRGRQNYDRNGMIARQEVSDALENGAAIERFLRLPYLRQAPPKSTGRDDFTPELFRALTAGSKTGLVATATLMTVTSIIDSYERWILARRKPLHQILFSGGGAKNGFLIELLSREFRTRLGIKCGIVPHDPQRIESEAFAYFGIRTLLAQELGGKFTGATSFGSPGHIAPGTNWNQVLAALTQWRA